MKPLSVKWLTRALGGAMLAAVAMPVGAATDIGKTVVVVKTVIGTLETRVRQLVLNDGVSQNEVIATQADAASEIQFVDGTKISVGPNAKVTLDKFVYDPDPSKGAFYLSAVSGVFRFVTGSMAHQSYQVETPNGTIGVRGTVIIFTVSPDHTTLNTVFGDAYMIDKNGIEVPIHQGQTHTIWNGPHGDDNQALNDFQNQTALLNNLLLAGVQPAAGGGPPAPGPGPSFNQGPSGVGNNAPRSPAQ